jgi:hypothetical protein
VSIEDLGDSYARQWQKELDKLPVGAAVLVARRAGSH